MEDSLGFACIPFPMQHLWYLFLSNLYFYFNSWFLQELFDASCLQVLQLASGCSDADVHTGVPATASSGMP